MRGRWRHLLVVLALLALPLALASCGFPVAGGIVGALLFVAALLAGGLTLTSLTGCDDSVKPGDLSPCLTMRREAGPDGKLDGKVGPCLSPRPPDLGPDLKIGPCLDVAPDKGPDHKIGPCLDIAPDKGTPKATLEGPAGAQRLAAIDRLEADGVLTCELAARLRRVG